MTDSDWVKLHLPVGVVFDRNSVTLTVDAAVTDALATEDNRELALASLLDFAASTIGKKSETMGDYSYTLAETTRQQASYWMEQGRLRQLRERTAGIVVPRCCGYGRCP